MRKAILAAAAVAILAPSGARADYIWTGAVNDKFFTPGNWSVDGGAAPSSLVSGSASVFRFRGGAAPTVVNYNSSDDGSTASFVIGTIRFDSNLGGPVTIIGDAANVTQIVNESQHVNTFSNRVNFAGTVNLTGSASDVAFWGEARGTLPEGHTNFVGKYVLSASKWTLHSPINIADGSSITGEGLEIATHGPRRINGGTGSKLKVKKLSHADSSSFNDACGKTGMEAGELFGNFKGDVEVNEIYFTQSHKHKIGMSSFSGTLTAGYTYLDGGNFSDSVPFSFTGGMVVGNPVNSASECGFKMKTGDFTFGDKDSHSQFYLGCTHNYIMTKTRATATDTRENGFAIADGCKLIIDTSDYNNPAVGHTVTVVLPDDRWNATMIAGKGSMEVKGCGTLWLKDACQFTGGLTVGDTATLKLDGGAHPGEGNLELKDSANMLIKDIGDDGTIDVAGSLTLRDTPTLEFNNLMPGNPALIVHGGVYVPAGSKPKVKLTGASLSDGLYCLMTAQSLPETLDIRNEDIEAGSSLGSKFTVRRVGAALYLIVGDTVQNPNIIPGGIWSGGGSDDQLSNTDNWLSGRLPQIGDTLQFYSIGMEKEIDFGTSPSKYGTVVFGSGVVKIHGKLHVAALTNSFNLAVMSDGTLEVDDEIFVNRAGVFLYSNEGTVTVGRRVRAEIRSLSGQYISQYAYASEESVRPIKTPKIEYYCKNRDTGGSEGIRGQLMLNLASGSKSGIVQPGDWVIGSGGLVFEMTRDAVYSAFEYYGGKVTLHCSDDWTLPDGNGNNGGDINCAYGPQGTVVFDTTKYGTENVGCTVTIKGCISDSKATSVSTNVVVRGCGKLVIDTQNIKGGGIARHLLVERGATLFLMPGKWISNAGSGTVALADGGMVGWNLSTNITSVADEPLKPLRTDVNILLPKVGRGYISLEGDRLDPGKTYRLLSYAPEGWREHLGVNGSAVRGRTVKLKLAENGHLAMEVGLLPFDVILR